MDEENPIEEIEHYVTENLEIALNIFEKEIYSTDYSIFKEIHEVMEEDENDHNCIGCNLGEQSMLTYSTLLQINAYTSISQKMNLLLITYYLLVERIDTILSIVDLHQEYRKETFKTLNKIRKWANFIKHPKAFILAHHPIYTIKGYKGNPEIRKDAEIIIDEPFLLKYYSNEKKNKELFVKFENKEGIVVIFPNPVDITSQFCKELKLFNRLLNNNEIYRTILRKRSTFLGFWIDED